MIYDAFKKDIINEFKIKRDSAVTRNNLRYDKYDYLFQIDNNFNLYKYLIRSFDMICQSNVLKLVETLCEKYNFDFEEDSYYSFDCSINLSEKFLIRFIPRPQSLNAQGTKDFAQQINDRGTSTIIVFLIKNSVDAQKGVNGFLNRIKRYTDNINIQCFTFEEFLFNIFGENELIGFQSSMSTIKEEIRTEFGYQITEIFNEHTLAKFKQRIEKTIVEFDYDVIKSNAETNRFITDYNYNHIKNLFLNDEKYKVLLGNGDFAESLITSEWLYHNYVFSEHLDNTYIVAGYLKSIEQLLWDILLIIAQGRRINGCPIDESNEEIINNTLGSLNYFLNDWGNKDLFENAFGNSTTYVMGYINEIISNWRRLRRNGYFHKDNLNDINKIELIRNETFFIYMLIIGSLELSENDLDKLIL